MSRKALSTRPLNWSASSVSNAPLGDTFPPTESGTDRAGGVMDPVVPDRRYVHRVPSSSWVTVSVTVVPARVHSARYHVPGTTVRLLRTRTAPLRPFTRHSGRS